jgi:hypothetical protein
MLTVVTSDGRGVSPDSRQLLFSDASALAQRGLIDTQKLQELKAPNGFKSSRLGSRHTTSPSPPNLHPVAAATPPAETATTSIGGTA